MRYARHGGTFITQSELKQSLDPIQRIRKAAGDEIEIALDLSSKWNLPCSLQIAHSLEPYGIMWLEDPMLADDLSAYASLARETSIPICISERLATRYRFREMFEQHAVDVVMYDVTWCGGISEAAKSRIWRTPTRSRPRRILAADLSFGSPPFIRPLRSSTSTSWRACITSTTTYIRTS